jgi:hypothetical protein
VVDYLFDLSNGRLPSSADTDALVCVLEARALLNGRKEEEDSDWQENLLDQDPLTLCLYTLTTRKAPEPMEVTSSQILEQVDLLAAKENMEKEADWPKSPSRMSIAIKQRRLVLKELEILVTKLPRQGTSRKWRFEVIDGDDGDAMVADTSSDVSPSASSPNVLPGYDLRSTDAVDDALLASLTEIVAEDLQASPLQQDEILQWVPETWEGFHANESAISKLTMTVDDVMVGKPGHNLLLTGDNGTGREALIVHAARSLLCYEPQKSDPCGKCPNCQWGFGSETEFGTAEKEGEINFMQIDCRRLASGKLEFEASKVLAFPGRLIVYLCGLDCLKNSVVNELLEIMEDKRFLWLAKATRAGDVNPELLKLFAVEQTTKPTRDQLARFLASRCRDWGIKVDSAQVLVRLAHRSGQVTGEALKVLAQAAECEDRTLTTKMVEHAFDMT